MSGPPRPPSGTHPVNRQQPHPGPPTGWGSTAGHRVPGGAGARAPTPALVPGAPLPLPTPPTPQAPAACAFLRPLGRALRTLLQETRPPRVASPCRPPGEPTVYK